MRLFGKRFRSPWTAIPFIFWGVIGFYIYPTPVYSIVIITLTCVVQGLITYGSYRHYKNNSKLRTKDKR